MLLNHRDGSKKESVRQVGGSFISIIQFRHLFATALCVISKRCLRIANFGADVAGIVEDAWEMLGFNVTSHVGDCSILEHSTEAANSQGTLSRDVNVKIFSGGEFWIVVLP